MVLDGVQVFTSFTNFSKMLSNKAHGAIMSTCDNLTYQSKF